MMLPALNEMIPALEEEGIALVCDDIYIYLLSYDVHQVDLVCRDGTDDDAVVVVIERLYLG